jgi:hypothetical protein
MKWSVPILILPYGHWSELQKREDERKLGERKPDISDVGNCRKG